MRQTTPWYTCDTCDRAVGKGWQNKVTPEMKLATQHFCNNNCKALYPKKKLAKRVWVGDPFPKTDPQN